jgi:hypothetical protein
MKTLRDRIEAAHELRARWNIQRAREVVTRLCTQLPNARVDWDEGDEEWARVIVGSDPVILVSAKLPLVIAQEPHDKLTIDGAEELGFIGYAVDDFSKKQHYVEKSFLESVFGRELSGNLSYDALSINDLWWATVS